MSANKFSSNIERQENDPVGNRIEQPLFSANQKGILAFSISLFLHAIAGILLLHRSTATNEKTFSEVAMLSESPSAKAEPKVGTPATDEQSGMTPVTSVQDTSQQQLEAKPEQTVPVQEKPAPTAAVSKLPPTNSKKRVAQADPNLNQKTQEDKLEATAHEMDQLNEADPSAPIQSATAAKAINELVQNPTTDVDDDSDSSETTTAVPIQGAVAVPAAAKNIKTDGAPSSEVSDGKVATGKAPTGEVVRNASELRAVYGNPQPQYPIRDRAAKREGIAIALAEVRSDGRLADVRLEKSSGSPSMDQAALEAFKRWRFQAGQEGWIRQPFQFRLIGDTRDVTQSSQNQ